MSEKTFERRAQLSEWSKFKAKKCINCFQINCWVFEERFPHIYIPFTFSENFNYDFSQWMSSEQIKQLAVSPLRDIQIHLNDGKVAIK